MDNTSDSSTAADRNFTIHSPGDLIDERYRVNREVARGETHVFYEVDDTMLSERLLLKRLLSTQSNPNLVTGFIQVGNASRKFSGRSNRFVSVHTLERDDYGPYLILDFITAPTLRTRMQDGSIASLDLAMTILRDIAQGLADLHEEGYVHRDIKPDNIFVQDGGNVLLADFGISKDMASSAGTMLPGGLSRNYGSPEQAKGLPTTQASDIYAFGAVAYELFSGDAPYGAIEPLTELVPGIDQGISDLVMRCLAQRPERRPQNGSELVAALRDSTSIQKSSQSVESIQATSLQTNTTVDVLRSTQSVQPIVQNAATVTVTQRWQDKYPALAQYIADLRPIPGGEFWMGDSQGIEFKDPFFEVNGVEKHEEAEDLNSDARPSHFVRLSPFSIGATPITVKLWQEYCVSNGMSMPIKPDWGWDPDHPIVNVSWFDIMGSDGENGFCGWASKVSSTHLNLPTEAQWEFTARGGDSNFLFPWGVDFDDRLAWTSCVDVRHSPAPVHRHDYIYRNCFGVSDLVGNVTDWCRDWYSEYPVEEISISHQGVREVPASGLAGKLGKVVSEQYQYFVTESMPPELTTDPIGPNGGDGRCMRGGAFCVPFCSGDWFTCYFRGSAESDDIAKIYGFRLVIGPS